MLNRSQYKFKGEKTRIKKIGWVIGFLLILGGCQLKMAPSTSMGNNTSTLESNAKPLTSAGSQTNSREQDPTSSTTRGESTKTSQTTQSPVNTTTGSLALEKFRNARESLQSEKMTHLWSVESNFPLKTGRIIQESNYNATGELETGWGEVEETEGVQSLTTKWYQTEQELVIEEAGSLQRYPLSQVQTQNKYNFNLLFEKILSDYSVSKETGEYYVKLTTQDKGLIQELLECLGYRKAEQEAYDGNLFLEARLDEATGNLRLINYVFKQRVDGYTDNGAITFKDWNIPVSVVLPDEPLANDAP